MKSEDKTCFFYRGYEGICSWDDDDYGFFGVVQGTTTTVTFSGKDMPEAEFEFHKAVDKYLEKFVQETKILTVLEAEKYVFGGTGVSFKDNLTEISVPVQYLSLSHHFQEVDEMRAVIEEGKKRIRHLELLVDLLLDKIQNNGD